MISMVTLKRAKAVVISLLNEPITTLMAPSVYWNKLTLTLTAPCFPAIPVCTVPMEIVKRFCLLAFGAVFHSLWRSLYNEDKRYMLSLFYTYETYIHTQSKQYV